MVLLAQSGRALDCGSSGRRFDSCTTPSRDIEVIERLNIMSMNNIISKRTALFIGAFATVTPFTAYIFFYGIHLWRGACLVEKVFYPEYTPVFVLFQLLLTIFICAIYYLVYLSLVAILQHQE